MICLSPMGDRFTKEITRRLAMRSGYRCSRPDCRKFTCGPTEEPGATTVIGEACHITAASSPGPRFDASLSQTQRSHIENGIWLCRNHHKEIDDDEEGFPSGMLREWKRNSEDQARFEFNKPHPVALGADQLLIWPKWQIGALWCTSDQGSSGSRYRRASGDFYDRAIACQEEAGNTNAVN